MYTPVPQMQQSQRKKKKKKVYPKPFPQRARGIINSSDQLERKTKANSPGRFANSKTEPVPESKIKRCRARKETLEPDQHKGVSDQK